MSDATATLWRLQATAEGMHVLAAGMRPKARANAFRADLDRAIEHILFDQTDLADTIAAGIERQLAVDTVINGGRP